ncbi:SpoIIE family protein phosphatase [Lipingzhangella sp. LS1_29]|uniref:SpoIIE family protein phosphatase n=1 Tax=Lipingzhangella rawalii TaxID=2055835 RepID=A0ABU2H3N0_9ACTN|nr:SpoIIE family protein phosphatase [Lipingzhangella rawalii]MDS1269908.1 SpoIIE family protein phosphatase [Lipingzhangella rawalii]
MPQHETQVVSREFTPTPEAARAARDFVAHTLGEWGLTDGSPPAPSGEPPLDAEMVNSIVLLVSELVTNAVVHAESTLQLTLRRTAGVTEVVVADRAPERAVPQAGSLAVDVSPSMENDRVGGLGLALANAMASSWGVTYSPEDKAVWFRFADPGVAAPDAETPAPQMTEDRARRDRRPDRWAALSTALNARQTMPEMLERTVDYARTVLGGDAAYIALATTDETEWEVQAAVGLSSQPWHPIRSRTEETFPSATPEPGAVINDDLMLARAHRGILVAAGMRSLVTAPLIVEGRITGLLGVASRRPRHFGTAAAARLQEGADRIALPVERARLARVEITRRSSLSFLAEASDLLAGTLDERMTAALAGQLTTARLTEWCVVQTTDELGEPRLTHATHRNENYTDALNRLVGELPPSEQWHPQPLWTLTAIREAGLENDVTRELVQCPAVCVPLLARGRQLGRFVVGAQPQDGLTTEDVDVASDLARRVSSALENARLYSSQTSMSMALQRSLLPAKRPEIPGVDYGVFYQPAGEGSVVGGDFYDVFASDGRWCFAIGDVCGTGPEAAAVTGLARHTLRALAREGYSPAQIMHRLNLAILDENPATRFLTMLYAEMTPIEGPEGGMGLRMVSAGHPLPLRLRQDGHTEPLGTPQPLLGAFEDIEFNTESIDVAPGDVLLAVTDGVTERRNGSEMLDEEGLISIFSRCTGLTAQAVISRIERELEMFAPGGHTDDTAMLVLRFR